jgi:hypothetical protein
MNTWQLLVIFSSGFIGGMMNAVAGGGTLVTFPTLLWQGLPPINANATNAFALWPGSLSGAWGFRAELRQCERRFFLLIAPSLIGGLSGAMLLWLTPEKLFARLAPFLILFATLLFMAQEPVQKWLRRRLASDQPRHALTGRWLIQAVFFQLLAATYGGYFGAGMGIVMLANLGLVGMTDIHQMNGLKNLLGALINLIAALWFVKAGIVHWPEAMVMMTGAIFGGYCSAGVARRLGREFARRTVIVIGLLIALSMLIRQ